MNKKILIASLFATLMLMLPMTSVVGVSDVNDDCGCEVENKYDLLKVKLLLVRLEVYINIILIRVGHIPEIAEKCYEILDDINSNRQWDFPIICDILESLCLNFYNLSWYYFNLALKYEPYYDFEFWIYAGTAKLCMHIVNNIGHIMYSLGCDLPSPPED